MSERVEPEIASCLGWLAFGILFLAGVFVYGWCQDFGAFILIPFLSGIISLAILCFGLPLARRALLPTVGALFLGALPHLFFLIAFNTAPDTTRLAQIANIYEVRAVAFHQKLEPFANLAWYWWAPIFLVVGLAGVGFRYSQALSRVLGIKGAFEFFCLILAVASSITFFSQTPGGHWTADVRARIRAEIPKVLEHQFPVAVGERVLETLKANSGWRQAVTQDVDILDACTRHILLPLKPRPLEKNPDLDEIARYQNENDNFEQHKQALYEELNDVLETQTNTLASRFADAVRKSLRHIAPAEGTLPSSLDKLHDLQREQGRSDRRLENVNAAIRNVVVSAFKSAWPEGATLTSDIARDFADKFIAAIGEKIDELTDGLTLGDVSLLRRRWSLQLDRRDLSVAQSSRPADWKQKFEDRVVWDRERPERIKRQDKIMERIIERYVQSLEAKKIRP